jgi:XTP/dITP diphosphohydrolase
MRKLVFATNNQHKLREAREIITDGFEIVSLAEIGCHDEIPETAETLEGNALIKARWVHDRYGYDCFADDTGLMVDALDGAPGVYSARYAGEGCTPADNVKKLLHEMQGVENRTAHFATVIALIADGEEHCFEGRVEGKISETPSGDGGFGYDPIFCADESGKNFAEMSADEKNAISHRGRAMRKLREFLGIFLLALLSMVSLFSASASQWKLYPTFTGDVESIIDTHDYTYMLCYAQELNTSKPSNKTPKINILRYDKNAEDTEFISSQNYLSENIVKFARYNYDQKFLCLVYESGNMDLLYDNGNTVTISGLSHANGQISRVINSITFDSDGTRIFVGTEFGYMIIDSKQGEIQSSRNFHESINSVAQLGDEYFYGMTTSLLHSSNTGCELDEMSVMSEYTNVTKIVPFGDALYIYYGDTGNKRVARIEKSGNSFKGTNLSSVAAVQMERDNNRIRIIESDRIRTIDTTGKETSINTLYNDRGAVCSSYDGSTYWFAHGREGFGCKRVPTGSETEWPITMADFIPDAANPFISTSMAYHPTYGMLVRGFHYNAVHMNRSFTHDVISGLKNMSWTPLSTTYRTNMRGLLTYTANGIAIDPNNSNHVYSGSHLNGMLRLDLANPENSIHMSKPSDSLGGYGLPGFAVVNDDFTLTSWKTQNMFSNPVFDTSDNLWYAHIDPDKAIQNSNSYTEFWYWTPEDRTATTSYTNVKPWHIVEFPGTKSGGDFLLYAPKSSTNKNTLIFHGGEKESALTLIDHKGNPGNRAGWTVKTFMTCTDQDGNNPTFWRLRCMLEDPSTGLIWIGHTEGVLTLDLQTNLSNTDASASVRRLKVARNDGTNLADYLLDGITVNAIVIDGESRKWFGTEGAGLVCTASDGRTILSTYTTDNSELPDNTIYAMAYNSSNNSLTISTASGLCEYYISGSASTESSSDVRAYPNPVRPNFYGYVTIDNLPDEAVVKITDVAGNLIKELGTASMGACTWDVTNLSNKRVPAGVYLILASNGADADSFAQVSKILVIN